MGTNDHNFSDGQNNDSFWKKCSTCKKPIHFGASYYTCSVSTCNGQRTGYSFCSMQCFESHLPGARHRDAGAVNQKAPLAVSSTIPASAAAPKRIIVSGSSSPATSGAVSTTQTQSANREVLVIASRLKEYIAAKADFNTSASVMDVLSDYLRILCDRAIDEARADGRKTVMDRDFSFLKKG